jgi:uncharacterized protein (DUF2267 family)
MSISSVDTVERNVHKTNEWLADLADELGTQDRAKAWRVLRAYLHLLRQRLTIEEAAQLAAQLPDMLRGVFYEGFDPTHEPEKVRDRDQFLTRLAERAGLADPAEAELAVTAATRVLCNHVSPGEMEDVQAQLPKEIREVLAQC